MFLKTEKVVTNPPPLTFTAYPITGYGGTPIFFNEKKPAKDIKEITYMPSVTFFSV